MSNDTILAILVFVSINIAIYVALLRWASRIEDIERNLESINARLEELTETIRKFQGDEADTKAADNPNDEDLH